MNKTVRKVLSITLMLILLFTLALPASATTTIEWTGANGSYNSLSISKVSAAYYVYQPIKDATIANHVYGTQNVVTWPTGYCATYTLEEDDFPDNTFLYKIHLDEAFTGEGLVYSVSSNVPSFDYYVVPAGLPDGKYSYGTEITTYDISLRISLNAIPPEIAGRAVTPDNYISGTVYAVPTSCTAAKLITIPE